MGIYGTFTGWAIKTDIQPAWPFLFFRDGTIRMRADTEGLLEVLADDGQTVIARIHFDGAGQFAFSTELSDVQGQD